MEGPKETRRTVIDVNMKEYTNHGLKGDDETMVKVIKSTSQSLGNRYQFSETKGSNWNLGGNIGAQVIGMATAGVSGGIGANYGRNKSTTSGGEQSEDNTTSISYEQEERIKVPPGTRVKARITSYKVKYEQQYTIKVGINSNFNIPVTYKTRCQQCCCGSNSGTVNITQMLNTLPYYSLEGGKATLTLVGTLSWITDGCSVEKFEESLI